uniref:D8 n=1 Tax=Arundo donax TaxID=35708 RepID=A0A0A9QZU6_ARUDO
MTGSSRTWQRRPCTTTPPISHPGSRACCPSSTRRRPRSLLRRRLRGCLPPRPP